ncbi:hypothetical protein DM860_018085 [Cuscuta australis]|uniref:Uncharacterized protein n=1 Tax=Cuscuta australis TaxID=267555 RepID=A0A328DCE4_9ASTE|nr:hypothetical protein DM860_018085 [Cuscuta australis]
MSIIYLSLSFTIFELLRMELITSTMRKHASFFTFATMVALFSHSLVIPVMSTAEYYSPKPTTTITPPAGDSPANINCNTPPRGGSGGGGGGSDGHHEPSTPSRSPPSGHHDGGGGSGGYHYSPPPYTPTTPTPTVPTPKTPAVVTPPTDPHTPTPEHPQPQPHPNHSYLYPKDSHCGPTNCPPYPNYSHPHHPSICRNSPFSIPKHASFLI